MGYEIIYQKLKDEIIWLDIRPGTMIDMAEVANRFCVSRTPVKEALVHLNADGWTVRQGSHFISSPLTFNLIRDLTEIRSFMEIQAYTWAMYRISSQGVEKLESIVHELSTLKNITPNRKIVEIDFKFHTTLFHATGNKELFTFLERILCHFMRFWLSRDRAIEPETFFKETRAIIKAIKEKDEINLRAATIGHIKSSLDEIKGL